MQKDRRNKGEMYVLWTDVQDPLLMLWNLESQNTPQRTLKTVEYSLSRQQVQGESVPNRDPDVSERPSFIPPPLPAPHMTGYMLATSLLYMTEFYSK